MYRREELRVRMQQREKFKQRAETVPVNADHPTVDWDGVINARVLNPIKKMNRFIPPLYNKIHSNELISVLLFSTIRTTYL